MSLVNKDYIWRISGSTGTHKKIIEKEYDTRLGVIWFLLTNWSDLPSRFTIQRMRKPYLASPRKKEDVFCADDPFVANLANQLAERE